MPLIYPRTSVRKVVRYPVPQQKRYDKLRLDKNENCAGVPPELFRKILRGVNRHFLAAYPEPYTLYNRLAGIHGVGVEQLLVTPGSEMAIRYVFETYLEPGDAVVALNPSFAMFEVYARLCGAEVHNIDFDNNLLVSPDEVERCIAGRVKIIAIANPNNPTGTVIEEKGLLRIIRKAGAHGALVMIDEAYYEFYGRTMLDHLGRHPNLIVTRTFSKALGAAGLRLGYAIGHQRVIRAVSTLQPIDHVNAFAVLVGNYLLDHPAVTREYVARVNDGRAFLVDQLADLGLPVVAGHGNFVLADVGRRRARVVEALRERGVLVGAHLRLPFRANYIRITLGPVPEMKRFVREFAAVWR